MTRFTDGPAAGVVLHLARSPLYLRVVQTPSGEWDALDQLRDVPEAGETIHAYRRVSQEGTVHLSYRDRDGRRRGRWLSVSTYAHVAEQPADEVLRSTELWRSWATETHARESGRKEA